MKVLKRWLGALATLVTLAQPMFASTAINGITQKHWRNATSVAVQAVVTGDDDTNSVVRIWQRYYGHGASYDSGMTMVRRPGTHVYNGRILWLPEGQTADYFVKADDGGTPQSTAADSASCSRYALAPTSGTQYYVDKSGSDSYDGSSPTFVSGTTGPKLTVGAAISKLASDNATTGAVVNVGIGEFHEAITLTGGTNGRFYSLVGVSRDSSIICGANPNIELGTYNGTDSLVWTLFPCDGCASGPTPDLGVDSLYGAYFPSNGGPADSTQLIVLGFGEYIHRKTSIKGILQDSTITSGIGPSTNQGELSGWYWQNDTLYVKRRNGQSPSTYGNHFGYRELPIKVTSRNWTIRNLTVRYAGSQRNDNANTETSYKTTSALVGGTANPGLNGHCIQFAASSAVASGGSVIGCRLYGANQSVVHAINWSGNGRSDTILVANCLIDGLGIGSMAYSAGKGRAEEGMVAVDARGSLSNVFNNYVNETYKGFIFGTQVGASTDSTWGSRGEYSNNTLTGISDDGIEVDNSADVNVLVLNNKVRGSTSAFSCIGGHWGPVFVFYNQLFARANGIKMGSGNRATYYLYHNTILADPPTDAAGFRAVACVGGSAQHYYLRNNIFGDNTTPTFDIQGATTANGPTGDSLGYHTAEYNYNGYQIAVTGNSLAEWLGVTRTLTTLRSALVWEKDGRELVGAVGFAGESVYNVSLLPSSTAVNKGARLAGINAAFAANRYNDTAPDLGASESAFVALTRHSWLWHFLHLQ